MPLADNFRANLKTALDKAGMTQRALAEKSGVHYVTICRILSGEIEPSLGMCERLAAALKLVPEKSFGKSA